MHAIELDATIDAQHVIHAVLPDTVPPGKARLILLYEQAEPQRQEREFGRFRGHGHVPDDFDQPLPEAFWTGASA
jgi:hypothetical protein